MSHTSAEENVPVISNDLTFRTKTGYCHILPDKIVLTRNGNIGDMANLTVGKNSARILVIYSIIATGILYSAFDSIQKGVYGTAFLLIGVASFLVYGIIRSTNHSATPVIDIEKIRSVRFKNAGGLATSAYFTVHFMDANEKIKRRLIALPGLEDNGEEEAVTALAMMKSRFTVAEI